MDNYQKLLKLMEYIEIEEGDDGLYIDIKSNIHLMNHGNFINKIKGNFVLVTDSENGGLVYLNPNGISINDDRTINQTTDESYLSYVKQQEQFEQKSHSSTDECRDCE